MGTPVSLVNVAAYNTLETQMSMFDDDLPRSHNCTLTPGQTVQVKTRQSSSKPEETNWCAELMRPVKHF